jgi:hypothetical protein
MAAMFGSSWLLRPNERIQMIRDASEHARQVIVHPEPGMMSPFILAMVGQVPLRRLIELIRESRAAWNRDLPEILQLPGAADFCRDIDHILNGHQDQVSWAGVARSVKSGLIQGVTERSIRALRPGDALLLEPASRDQSVSVLLKNARSVCLSSSDDRRLYTAETVEYPETGNFCVAIRRRG